MAKNKLLAFLKKINVIILYPFFFIIFGVMLRNKKSREKYLG